MRFAERILSALLSCAIAVTSAAAVPVSAASDVPIRRSSVYYDNINSEESKDPDTSDSQPFNVFEIYNAYYGITTPPVSTAATTAAVSTSSSTVTSVSSSNVSIHTSTGVRTTSFKTKPATTAKPLTTAAATTKKPATTVRTSATVSLTANTTNNTTSQTSATESSCVTTPETSVVTTAVTTLRPGELPAGTYLRGIDVSEHQYSIDWQQVADSGMVDYVIIRAGYGRELYQIDKFFKQNIEGAQAAGLDVGIYWFSYAMSVEEAELEAQVCYEIIKDYSFNYPIYFDIEYEKALNTLSNAELSAMADTFCTYFHERGYYTGVYSYASCLQSKIYRQVLDKYDIWVAQYNTSVNAYDGHYEMWQYTSTGSVPGIATNVDMNYGYRNYPEIIGVNPSGGSLPATPEKTTAPTVTATASVSSETMPVQSGTDTVPTTTTALAAGCIIDMETSVDWENFDKEKYQYAMFVASSSQDLENTGKNIDAAHEAGIDCGIFYKADDSDVETAVRSADQLINMLSGRKLEYPIYYWIDKDDLSLYSVGAEQMAVNVDAFCSELENAKFFAGVAAYDNLLSFQLDGSLYEKYNAGVFNEKDTLVFFPALPGIVCEYDSDTGEYICYSKRSFPAIMAAYGLNGYYTNPN